MQARHECDKVQRVDPAQQLARVTQALHDAVRRSGWPLHEMSERLGQHPAYLSRALRGRGPLRFLTVLRLLDLLGLFPEDFFEILFPLGGEAAVRLAPPTSGRPGDDDLRSLSEAMRRARAQEGLPPWTPDYLTERAGKVLRELLRRGGARQREVSAALGLGASSLGQALRGNAALNLQHVFGTLAAIGVSPARFFAELFGPEEKNLLGSLRWTEYLDQMEGLMVGAFEAIEARRGGGEAPRPSPTAWETPSAAAPRPAEPPRAERPTSGRAGARPRRSGGGRGPRSRRSAR
jgi:transcriptional regulator with XRE-family HTH domain